MQSQYRGLSNQVTEGHDQCRQRNDDHSDHHGGDGTALLHQGGDHVDEDENNQRVHVGIPSRRSILTYHTYHILGHGGIHLTLYHPETAHDDDQQHQAAIEHHLHHRTANLQEAFSFTFSLDRFIKQVNSNKCQECHRCREVVQIDQSLVTHASAKRVHHRLAGESTDVHHHIEEGITTCSVLRGCFTGNRAGDHRLDEGTPNHDQD